MQVEKSNPQNILNGRRTKPINKAHIKKFGGRYDLEVSRGQFGGLPLNFFMFIGYASCGPTFWPSLRRNAQAPTIKL